MAGLNDLVSAAVTGGKPGPDNPDAPTVLAPSRVSGGKNLLLDAFSAKDDPMAEARRKNAERRRIARDGR